MEETMKWDLHEPQHRAATPASDYAESFLARILGRRSWQIPTRDSPELGIVPETIKGQDPCDDAAVDQEIGKACHRWDDIEEEVLLFAQQRIAGLGGGIGND